MNDLFTYLGNYIRFRIETELGAETVTTQPTLPKLRKRGKKSDSLQQFILEHKLTEEEILITTLAIVPHISAGFLDGVISSLFPSGGEFAEFGGIKGKNHRGIVPTGETALYILAGNDPVERMEIKKLIDGSSRLSEQAIVYLGPVPDGEPLVSGRLIVDHETMELMVTGRPVKPSLNADFPAALIETGMAWDDLILNDKTLDEVKEIETWLQYNETIMKDWGMEGKIKPGYRVMFCGPPGTGKTLTAALLGKFTNRDVYRIDLSMVVSKYIGQTEKNLGRLFDKAENKDWILFFDEADAIFGKRTNVRDAHDKYANQEVSYLLQRIEAHPGLVILASNFKSNIDTAFSRRFQSIIEYKLPNQHERKQLWESSLPKGIPLANDVSLDKLASMYEVTGANIINVVQYASLQKLKKDVDSIQLADLLDGIKKEYSKEDKMFG
ncbi:MAG: ATP-binding protein [Crocinitomicaceae bacterium]